MNFSDDWRSLWPISAVFSAPNLLSGHHSRPLGPLLFRPSSPSLPLLSSPALNLSLPAPLPSAALLDGLHNFFRSSSNAAFLPYSAVADLAADLLPSSPDDPLPSNTLAALRSRRDPSSLLLFFPSGDNAHFISYFSLDIKAPPPPPPPSPPELFEQRQGFKHPYHRISKLYVAPAAASDWESSDDEDVVEGFLIATTMYSVNWFRVENRILGSAEQGGQQRLNLVPVAKQGFESCVADACFSPHFPEESAVLLESGELCWFNLDTMHGGMVEVRLDGDNPGGWFGCKYGSQPWILVVACSAAVLLVDLRGKRSGEAKVLARVEMPGMFGVTRLLEGDWFTAFCKAGYNDFHFSVVTRTQLLLFDSRQPLVPVLMWDHGLICPSFVGMYRLSELRPSEEFKWASESGFAILVGSFWNDEFNLFCYGPREGGANGKSALYAWELPSALPLSGRCAFGDNAIKQELSKDDLVNGGELRRNDLVVGFYIVPNDLLRLDSEVSNIRGFALIRLMSSGKLEVQKYNASWDSCYEKSNDSGKDLKQTEFPIYSVAQEEQISTEYHFYKFQDLCAYMNGDLSSTLDIHDQHFNLKGNGQCFMHSEVRELMTDKLKSSSLSPSAFISEVTIPTSIFEIALRRVLTCNNMPHLAFSKYSEIFGSKCRLHFEFLDVPSCLPHHSLPPFFLVKPSRRSDKWLKKTSPGKALVGPVLPIPILLTLQQMDKGRDSSIVLKEASDGDLFSLECKTILENVFPEISIADTETASCAWSGSQEIQDEKPFFVYKPIFLDSLSTQKNSCYSSGHPIKEELPEINKKDHLLMNGKAAYNDENFTTFICGVADKTSSSDSKSDMAGDKLSQLFDVSPVRLDFDSSIPFHPDEEQIYRNLKRKFSIWYVLLGNHCDAWTFGAVDPNSGTATLLEKALTDPQLVCTTSVTEYWKPLADDVYCWKGLHFLAKQDLGGFSRFTDHGIEGIVPRELLPPDVQSKFHAKPSEKTK